MVNSLLIHPYTNVIKLQPLSSCQLLTASAFISLSILKAAASLAITFIMDGFQSQTYFIFHLILLRFQVKVQLLSFYNTVRENIQVIVPLWYNRIEKWMCNALVSCLGIYCTVSIEFLKPFVPLQSYLLNTYPFAEWNNSHMFFKLTN